MELEDMADEDEFDAEATSYFIVTMLAKPRCEVLQSTTR